MQGILRKLRRQNTSGGSDTNSGVDERHDDNVVVDVRQPQ